jgi:polar amino acid transport system substrate-binding protein
MKIGTRYSRTIVRRVFGAVVVVGCTTVASSAGTHSTAAEAAPQGTPLVVAIKPIDPFVSSTAPTPQGFSIDLMDELARRLGRPVTFNMYSKVAEVLTAVETKEADAGIAAISITAEREQKVDFSTPVFDAGLQILGRNESSGTTFFDSVKAVFSGTVVKFFAFLLVLVAAGGIAMFLSDRVDDDRRYKSFWDALWQSAVNLVTVGYDGRRPKRPITKLLAVGWMLMGLFIGAQFTAVLSSGLTVKELRNDISGPDDLDGVKVVTIGETTSSKFLDRRGIESTSVSSFADALKALKARTFDALVYDSPTIRFTANQDTSLRLLGGRFSPEFYGIAFPAGSALREQVDIALLQMREDGTFDALVERWFGGDS